MWSQELADLAAASPEFTHDFQVGTAKDPHLVVGSVREVEPLLIRIWRQPHHERRARCSRLRGDDLLGDELAALLEDLNAIATAIGHVDESVVRAHEAVHGGKLTRRFAGRFTIVSVVVVRYFSVGAPVA